MDGVEGAELSSDGYNTGWKWQNGDVTEIKYVTKKK